LKARIAFAAVRGAKFAREKKDRDLSPLERPT
jgi:hypothetical protein